MIAATLEEKLGKLDEALKEYRKVTWGNFTGEAQAPHHRLTAKSLTIVTERVFRSDETPKIKLTTPQHRQRARCGPTRSTWRPTSARCTWPAAWRGSTSR